MLPGCIEIVDLWHAKEHLWAARRSTATARTARAVIAAGLRGAVDGANAVLLALRAAVFNDDFWQPPGEALPLAA